MSESIKETPKDEGDKTLILASGRTSGLFDKAIIETLKMNTRVLDEFIKTCELKNDGEQTVVVRSSAEVIGVALGIVSEIEGSLWEQLNTIKEAQKTARRLRRLFIKYFEVRQKQTDGGLKGAEIRHNQD